MQDHCLEDPLHLPPAALMSWDLPNPTQYTQPMIIKKKVTRWHHVSCRGEYATQSNHQHHQSNTLTARKAPKLIPPKKNDAHAMHAAVAMIHTTHRGQTIGEKSSNYGQCIQQENANNATIARYNQIRPCVLVSPRVKKPVTNKHHQITMPPNDVPVMAIYYRPWYIYPMTCKPSSDAPPHDVSVAR